MSRGWTPHRLNSTFRISAHAIEAADLLEPWLDPIQDSGYPVLECSLKHSGCWLAILSGLIANPMLQFEGAVSSVVFIRIIDDGLRSNHGWQLEIPSYRVVPLGAEVQFAEPAYCVPVGDLRAELEKLIPMNVCRLEMVECRLNPLPLDVVGKIGCVPHYHDCTAWPAQTHCT